MLADDVAWALPQLRAEAERNMTDSCTITRAGTGVGPFNPTTGQRDVPPRVTVYAGPCRVQIKSVIASSSGVAAGERAGTVQEFELQLPVVGTEGVAIHDAIHMDSALLDPSLAGRDFRVAARHEKSQATARRLRVIEGTA